MCMYRIILSDHRTTMRINRFSSPNIIRQCEFAYTVHQGHFGSVYIDFQNKHQRITTM